MYHNKPPKGQKPRVEPYTIFNPHSVDLSRRDWNNIRELRTISIDPGEKNFAIRIEGRPFASNGGFVPYLFEKVNFSRTSEEDSSWSLFCDISRYLNQHRDKILGAHFVVVEKQLPVNYNAVRISQHVLTYFMEHLRDLPQLAIIVEVDPKTKGRILGAPPNLTKPLLKKWSAQKARDILTRRCDTKSLRILNAAGKKDDDLGDTVTQMEALAQHFGWPTTATLFP